MGEAVITAQGQDDDIIQSGLDAMAAVANDLDPAVLEEDDGKEPSDVKSGDEEEKGDVVDKGSVESDDPEEKEGKKEGKESDLPPAPPDDVSELKQLVRVQSRNIAVLQGKLNRIERQSAEATKKVDTDAEGFEEPGDKAEPKAVELTEVEVLQQKINNIAEAKGPILDSLIDIMEGQTSFSDIRTVCSQANFNDMFGMIGDAIAVKDGTDPVTAILNVEASVWALPNPYKYMYNLIKEHHPAYVAAAAKKPAAVAPDKDEKKGKAAPKSPSSIAGMGGAGDKGKTTWTAKRIDELDETELDKVPADVYEAYLRDELE